MEAGGGCKEEWETTGIDGEGSKEDRDRNSIVGGAWKEDWDRMGGGSSEGWQAECLRTGASVMPCRAGSKACTDAHAGGGRW